MLLIEAYLAAHNMQHALEVIYADDRFLASIVNYIQEPVHQAEGATMTEALTNLNELIHKYQ